VQIYVFFDRYSPYSKDGIIVDLDHHESACPGWPRLMTAYDGLGLVLTWTSTCGSTIVLQMLFGITQTCISDSLTFCAHIFIHVLQRMDDAKIKEPDVEKSGNIRVLCSIVIPC
jgi:hypothetical protein